jgi:hypothetical protein
MNWLFHKSKSGGALISDVVDDKAVDKSEFTRLKLRRSTTGEVWDDGVIGSGRRRSSAAFTDHTDLDTMDRIMDLCAHERDCTMCLFICNSHGIDPTRLALHWRTRLNYMIRGDRVASGKMLDALNAELRARRIKAIARDFETRLNSFAETEAECARLGLSVDDIVEFFGTRFPGVGAGDWRVKHSAELMDCLRNKRDRPRVHM